MAELKSILYQMTLAGIIGYLLVVGVYQLINFVYNLF